MKILRPLSLLVLICLISVQSRAGLFSVSDDQMIQAGRQAHDQIMQQYGTWEDPSQQARVDRIGSNLARFSQRPEIHYAFYLLNTDVINAVATPDGSLHVTRALMTNFPDKELTFVMGHEMTHVELRHANKQAEQAATTQAAASVISVLLGQNNSNLAQLGINGAAYLLTMKFSRDDETQADEGGLKLMQKAGIDPHYGVAALQRLQSLSQSSPGMLDQFLSDHPLDADRIAHAQQIADQLQPQGSVVPPTQSVAPSAPTATLPAGFGYLKGHVSVGPLCKKPCPDPPGADYTAKTLVFYDTSRNLVTQIHLNRNGYYKLAVPAGNYLYKELPDQMTAEFDAVDTSVQQNSAQSRLIKIVPNKTTYFNFTIWEKN